MFYKHAWPLLLLLAGCGRNGTRVPEHYAVLRFENLGADLAADWMGRALSEMVSADLPAGMAISSSRLHAIDRTLGPRPVSAPGISAERSAALAAGANRIGYGDYSVRDGRISARLTIFNPQTGRATRLLSAAGSDVIALAGDLARQISPRAGKYETASAAAVKDYFTALESGDPGVRTAGLSAAIAADPDFAPPYLLLAETRLEERDRDGALAALGQALARQIPPIERARVQLETASLRNDAAAREQALAALSKADPGDVDSWAALGEAANTRHDYRQAVEAYQAALRLRPDDPNFLNQLGYAQSWAGDVDGALRTFRHYQALRPNDANGFDSMADVLLIHGRLNEAVNLYLEADKKDRKLLGGGDLLKAAMARFLGGDVPGASALAQQFADARAALHDPAVPIFQAEWTWLTGDPKAAAALRSFAHGAENGPAKELAARAYTELAEWTLFAGDRAAAAQLALQAATLGAGGPAGPAAFLARFLTQPSAGAAEWNNRADQMFRNVPQPALKDVTLARALLLDRQYAAAVPVFQRASDETASDPSIPVLLAWALIESGHRDQAAAALRDNPVPPYNGIDPFAGLAFRRLKDLRAQAK